MDIADNWLTIKDQNEEVCFDLFGKVSKIYTSQRLNGKVVKASSLPS